METIIVEDFDIIITKPVEYRDMYGTLLERYEVGQVVRAYSERKWPSGLSLFGHSMGGIWSDEAQRV